MDVGSGTNTKSELLALWGLLFALHKNFHELHVRGDSLVIIDWALGKHSIHSLELEHWILRVKDLIGHFRIVTFQHVFREFNSLADDLSKKAIGMGPGRIFWEE